jgi:endonuclease/exonuclease/phosphatase (EEP) superfamily protein YafD
MADVERKKPTPARPKILLGGLVSAAGAVLSTATILGFGGEFWWLFDLFSHFRVQYLFGLVAVALLLFVLRQRKAAVTYAIFATSNLAVVLPLYFGDPVEPGDDPVVLRAMLLNVNTHSGDPIRVARIVSETNPQVLVLEEISARWLVDLEGALRAYPHSRVSPREDNFGIGLFSQFPLSHARVVEIGEAQFPSILADLTMEETSLAVIATHPPPPVGARYSRWRNSQLNLMPDHVPTDGLPILLLGDLNVSPWSPHFRRLLKRTGLRDSSKGLGVQPSWPAANPLLWIPIDHCLHSREVKILKRAIGPDVGSDHYPLIVDIALRRGK